jgi:predicted transcriptional regulator
VPEFGAIDKIEAGDQSNAQFRGQVTGQVTGQVRNLLKVTQGEQSKKELMEALQLTGRDNFEKLYLRPALEQGLLEMTIPGKPHSSRQKYRLTEKGRETLKAIKRGSA